MERFGKKAVIPFGKSLASQFHPQNLVQTFFNFAVVVHIVRTDVAAHGKL